MKASAGEVYTVHKLIFKEHIRSDILLDKAEQSVSSDHNSRQPQPPYGCIRQFPAF